MSKYMKTFLIYLAAITISGTNQECNAYVPGENITVIINENINDNFNIVYDSEERALSIDDRFLIEYDSNGVIVYGIPGTPHTDEYIYFDSIQ